MGEVPPRPGRLTAAPLPRVSASLPYPSLLLPVVSWRIKMQVLQSPATTPDRGRLLSARVLYPVAAILLCALLFSRRPDALSVPQFFAEDGRIFFHDQFLFGALEALQIPYGGYLLFIPRIVAMLGSLFPVSAAPAIYNGAALLLAALSCAVFCLPAFRSIIRSDLLRFAVCVVAIAALDTGELVGTITQIQWYLQFAAILLLFYSARPKAAPRLAAGIALALLLLVLALSVPMLVLAVPVALWIILHARGTARLPAFALLAGIAIQMVIYAGAGIARGQNSLFNFHHLLGPTAVYLAFRAVLSSIIGRPRAMVMCARGTFVPSLLIGAVVLLWLAWIWWKIDRAPGTPAAPVLGPGRRKILLCLYFAIASTLLSVGARNLPRSPITFGGERYFYLSACCVVLLVAITLERIPGWNWLRAVILILLFSGGLYANFLLPPYPDLHWDYYARRISGWDALRAEGLPLRAMVVPISPSGWFFVLEGNVLTNGGFEDSPHPVPWMGLGNNIGMEVTRGFHHTGKASLIMSGTEGEARQLVWGLQPGANMRAEAMVLMPCKSNLAATLLVEDGREHSLGGYRLAGQAGTLGAAADPHICDSWRKLTVTFQATSTGRALIRLQYHGAGDSILWDDVTLQSLDQ